MLETNWTEGATINHCQQHRAIHVGEVAIFCQSVHSVDLGLVKRLVLVWNEGSQQNCLSQGHFAIVNTWLKAMRLFMPPSFKRKPRGVNTVLESPWIQNILPVHLTHHCTDECAVPHCFWKLYVPKHHSDAENKHMHGAGFVNTYRLLTVW